MLVFVNIVVMAELVRAYNLALILNSIECIHPALSCRIRIEPFYRILCFIRGELDLSTLSLALRNWRLLLRNLDLSKVRDNAQTNPQSESRQSNKKAQSIERESLK